MKIFFFFLLIAIPVAAISKDYTVMETVEGTKFLKVSPDELSENNESVSFVPDSFKMRSSYTYYIFNKKALYSFFSGKKPENTFFLELKITQSTQTHDFGDSKGAHPIDGYKRFKHTCEPIKILENPENNLKKLTIDPKMLKSDSQNPWYLYDFISESKQKSTYYFDKEQFAGIFRQEIPTAPFQIFVGEYRKQTLNKIKIVYAFAQKAE